MFNAGGSCYVLGVGAQGQFTDAPKSEMSPSTFQQIGFDRMQTLWTECVEAMVAKTQSKYSAHDGANIKHGWCLGTPATKKCSDRHTILALTDNGVDRATGTLFIAVYLHRKQRTPSGLN